jgi:nitrous oxide reductase accessory protein NosL
LLAACSGDPGTGPAEVKWDRDVCTRCNMVLSDRQHAAQVRRTPADGKRSRVYRFDDIGCAVLWLEQQPWRDQPGVEIWVTDHRDGRWLDAHQAHYVTGHLTPMQYGLGAQAEPTPDMLSFGAAREHIRQVERKFNIHGGNLGHAAEAAQPPPVASPESSASSSSR